MVVSLFTACSQKKEADGTESKDAVNETTTSPDTKDKEENNQDNKEVVKEVVKDEPVKIKIYYSDNATLPFKEDWLTVTEAEKRFNVDFEFEVIPIADYATKVSLALNTGTNAPDVILYQTTKCFSRFKWCTSANK